MSHGCDDGSTSADDECWSEGASGVVRDKSDPLDRVMKMVIHDDDLGTTWDDIKGLDRIKEELRTWAVLPILRPELFNESRKPPSGILLYGAPGNGKTLLARAVAAEAKPQTFMVVSASCIGSKWFGESEAIMKAIFSYASSNGPSIIFIDELDTICPSRSDTSSATDGKILGELLIGMDGFAKTKNQPLIIAATNKPMRLDNALLRRFPRRYYIGPPRWNARLAMIQKFMATLPNTCSDNDYRDLAHRTDGASAAEIQSLLIDVAGIPLKGVMDSKYFRKTASRNRSKFIKEQEKYVACGHGEEGSIRMNISEIPKGCLVAGIVTVAHVRQVVQDFTPSTMDDDDDLEEFKEQNNGHLWEDSVYSGDSCKTEGSGHLKRFWSAVRGSVRLMSSVPLNLSGRKKRIHS